MANIGRETKLVAKHSSVYATGNFLRRIGALLLLPLYTTYLSPTDYGTQELIGLTVEIASILLATAISSSIYRFYFDTDDPVRRELVMSTSVLALAAIGLVTVLALFPLTGLLAGMILDDAGLAHYLMISFAALWFQTVNHVAYAWLRANQKSLQFVLLSLASFLMGIGLNVFFIVSLKLGVLGILLATLITSIFIFVAVTIPLFVKIGLHFDRGVLREILIFGWPNVISAFAGMVVRLSDRFFIKAYASIAEAGIYSLGCRFAAVPNQFVSEPFNQTWMPRRFEIAREPGSEQIFGRIFTYYLMVIAFAGLVVSGLTHDLMRLMTDSQYWSAAAVVPILVLANIVFTLHYHFNIGLMLEKKTTYIAVVNSVNVVMVLFLFWWLIPRYGSMGAACASLFAFAFKSTMTFVLGRRFYRIHFEGVRAAKILAASAAVYLTVNLLNVGPPVVSLVIKGTYIVVSYTALLLAMRFFTRDELAKAARFARRRLARGLRMRES